MAQIHGDEVIPLPYRWIAAGVAALALILGFWWWTDNAQAQGDARCQARVDALGVSALNDRLAKSEAENLRLAKKVGELEDALRVPDPVSVNLGQRLHHYEIGRCPVPQAPTHPGSAGPGSGVASGDEEIGRATDEVFAACHRDALRLNAAPGLWPR